MLSLVKILSVALIINLLFFSVYVFFEPQSVRALEDQIRITQTVTAEISITSPGDVTMSPSIPGMTGSGGVPSTGSATWTVITNNIQGFSMTIKSSTTPAMRGDATSDYFDDYTTTNLNIPDHIWGILSDAAEFGYTVEPETVADTVQLFRDNGTFCNQPGIQNQIDRCWLNASTSAVTIINRTASTTSSGEAEVVKFQVEQGASTFKLEDTYTATTTVTVVVN